MTITNLDRLYRATDALAHLTGELDAAINYDCPLALTDIRAKLIAARTTLFEAIHDVDMTLP